MNYRRIIIIFTISIPFILFSCNNNSVKELLIITEAAEEIYGSDFNTNPGWRLIPGSRIVSLDPEKPGNVKILTEEFESACYPEVSYDGSKILFSGRITKEEHWQIFEMNIRSHESRQVTSSETDCIDPVYLPSGRIAFSMAVKNDTVKSAYPLFTCRGDGSDLRQITFDPSASYATSVLRDGRILTLNNRLMPDQKTASFVVMRPDGTKADLFYRSTDENKIMTRARETSDGKVLFIEGKNYSDNDLVSISYNRPLHSHANLSAASAGSFRCVLPVTDGKIFVSYREGDSGNYSLALFNSEAGTVGETIYNNGMNVVDAVEAKPYERPKKLPSEVDLQVKTGLLLCQDINFTGIYNGGKSPAGRISRIEVMGVDSTYGVIEAESDGSFYLKVMADTPFQIRRIDDKGKPVGDPCTWLWLRPNERRGCVGCHEDPEIVPANRVALAVRKPPVIIPVHVSEIKEKIVELE